MTTHIADGVAQYEYPREAPRSPDYRVRLNGRDETVLTTDAADFIQFEFADATRACAHIEIEASRALGETALRPLSRGVALEALSDRLVRFTLDRPMNLCLDPKGLRPLFIYANPPETGLPERGAPGVHFFEGGRAHDIGELRLRSGETLYLEGGALLRGCVRACDAEGVRIAGRGVLDGFCYAERSERRRSIVFENCRDLAVRDIVMIRPTAWMLVLARCRGARVENIKQIGEVVSSDGIDVVASRDVRVTGCCLRNNDDCLVVKSIAPGYRSGDASHDWSGDVENVVFEGCALWNHRAGNAMEIGHETVTDRIGGIIFRDIDVMRVDGHGAVFSIHNGGRALVEDVTWDDIRVEHHYDKLVDFRVMVSRFSRCDQRGVIRGVRLRNVRVHYAPFNAGYTISLIGGYDATHRVEDVRFENVWIDGQKLTHPDQIELFTRHADHIRFD